MLDLLCGIVTSGLARQAYSIEILCNSLKLLFVWLRIVPKTLNAEFDTDSMLIRQATRAEHPGRPTLVSNRPSNSPPPL